MKLLIASYRASWEQREGCHCHSDYTYHDSDFELRVVGSLEEAASWIAERLHEAPHSPHAHAIVSSIADLDIGSVYTETRDIQIADLARRVTFSPGNIHWVISEENQDTFVDETQTTTLEQSRNAQLSELYTLLEPKYMALYSAAAEAERVKKQAAIDAANKRAREEKEAQFKRLGDELGKKV